MLLAVDIGNTNIVIGLFKADKLVSKLRILSGGRAQVNKIRGGFSSAIISSVVPRLTRVIARHLISRYKIRPIIVNWKKIKNLKVKIGNRSRIGVDRLVNAVAAKSLYGCPLVIIDFGTATTFCAVDKKGDYLGGAITSGLAISRDVLHERTAKLPAIEIRRPSRAIGRDTVEAMRSGLFFGYVDMVEGMIKRFKSVIGKRSKVIATGGLAKLIASGTDKIDVVDQDLTLKGLNMIYKQRS